MTHPRGGFTLLEVCLAMSISMLMIAAAVPWVSGVVKEQRLKRSFETFDAFAQEAKMRSSRERRAYLIKWEKGQLTLSPQEFDAGVPQENQNQNSVNERLRFEPGESYSLQRPAAMVSHPAAEWIFWPGGICEPVNVEYQGNAGKWSVGYEPLSCRGVFLESQVR